MKIKIIVAFALLAIGFGFYGLIKNSYFKEEVVLHKKEVVFINVWYLKENIKKGERLNRHQLAMKKIPEPQALKAGIAENYTLTFEDNPVYKKDLNKGEYVLDNDIISSKQDGYIDFIISKDAVPYPIVIEDKSIIGGVINDGDYIDILALTSKNTDRRSVNSDQFVSISPVLNNIKILMVKRVTEKETGNEITTLILELMRNQTVKLMVAERISEIEIYKSVGKYDASELHADAGDILDDFNAITEFRGSKVTIK
ncbi:Flp pilus assembly protein CpaB [Aliivibrio fischeri]|uniref:Flp pilus assembly protein CpaB n=1 Tax=Aliivibrio fischeri TaxID=668 RepID=UPI00084BECF6|nr:Flp pilus assembly protein CpaB [Aliivibrio fischeri]OED58168.1 Flp pilus assembly protein CpaB [Aliivibrio fischeri]